MSEAQANAGGPPPLPPRPRSTRAGRLRRESRYRLSVGAVLSRSFSIWTRNLPAILLLTLPVVVVLEGMRLFLTLNPTAAMGDAMVISLVGVLLMNFGLFLVAGTYAYLVFETLRGNRPAVRDSFRVGVRRLLPAAGIALVCALMVLLGTLLCYVPGVIALCMLYVSVPATVVERRGPGDAIGRSLHLTGGSRWGIFAVVLILNILFYAVMLGTQAVVLATSGAFWLSFVVQSVVTVLWMTLNGVAQTVVYHDLRQGKEGVDTDELVKVFE